MLASCPRFVADVQLIVEPPQSVFYEAVLALSQTLQPFNLTSSNSPLTEFVTLVRFDKNEHPYNFVSSNEHGAQWSNTLTDKEEVALQLCSFISVHWVSIFVVKLGFSANDALVVGRNVRSTPPYLACQMTERGRPEFTVGKDIPRDFIGRVGIQKDVDGGWQPNPG
jgi:hypothetical protein